MKLRYFGILLAIFGLVLLVAGFQASFQWIALEQAVWMWGSVVCMALGLSLAVGVPFKNHLRGILIVVALSLPWTFLFFLPIPSDWRLWPPTLVAFIAVLAYRPYYRKHHPDARH